MFVPLFYPLLFPPPSCQLFIPAPLPYNTHIHPRFNSRLLLMDSPTVDPLQPPPHFFALSAFFFSSLLFTLHFASSYHSGGTQHKEDPLSHPSADFRETVPLLLLLPNPLFFSSSLSDQISDGFASRTTQIPPPLNPPFLFPTSLCAFFRRD